MYIIIKEHIFNLNESFLDKILYIKFWCIFGVVSYILK